MKIALLTLGCKLNYAETSTYERGFRDAGLEVVPWNKGADIYLVNTCSVTQTSDGKSRNLIRKVHRINPEALIVVTGCSAQLRRAEIEAIEGVTRVFGATEKSRVVAETLAAAGIGAADAPAGSGAVFGAYSTGERTRSFLKVQDGCDNRCAYCTVPYARGGSRNVPIEELLCQARKIASEGVKEIVLTGVNTGDFGRTTGESFLDLLQALEKVESSVTAFPRSNRTSSPTPSWTGSPREPNSSPTSTFPCRPAATNCSPGWAGATTRPSSPPGWTTSARGWNVPGRRRSFSGSM